MSKSKSGAITINTFRNITKNLFSPVKAFDPGLKLLEDIFVNLFSHIYLTSANEKKNTETGST